MLRVLLCCAVLAVLSPDHVTGRGYRHASQTVHHHADKKSTTLSRNAVSTNINTCLFNSWNIFATSAPTCAKTDEDPLCYGSPASTLFIVCYNHKRLIPDFTSHLAPAGAKIGGRPPSSTFQADNGPNAPAPQATLDDYKCVHQVTDFGWDTSTNYFCSRGHLTPSGDFKTLDERTVTMILTNIAPQWQAFNGGNWAVLEGSITDFTENKNKPLYIFTGVAGDVGDKLNKRVVIPKYFWKAVCDTDSKSNYFFRAENPINVTSTTLKTPGCYGQSMTNSLGIITCSSVQAAASSSETKDYAGLPNLDPAKCGSTMGTFLDTYLKAKLK